MKKFYSILLVFLFLFISCNVLADEPLEMDDLTGGAGFTLKYLMLDLEDFNATLRAAGYPELSDGMITYGWNYGFGLRNGLRWGSFNYEGENMTTVEEAFSRLNFRLVGFYIGYGHVVHRNVDISGGINLGINNLELTLRTNELNQLDQPNKIFVKNTFFTVGPQLMINSKINEWLALQGVVGYLYGIGNDNWKDNKDITQVIPPFRTNGLIFGLNLHLGY